MFNTFYSLLPFLNRPILKLRYVLPGKYLCWDEETNTAPQPDKTKEKRKKWNKKKHNP
jgi:hypothetical protein